MTYLIGKIILDYFKMTVCNLVTITTNIQGCVLWKKSPETLNKILETHLRKRSLFSKVSGSKNELFTHNFKNFANSLRNSVHDFFLRTASINQNCY